MNAHLSMMDVIQNGVKPREHAPCPFCGHIPTGLARQCGPIYLVGCDEDACFDRGICAQASGKTPEAAWAAWDRRAPQLTVVSSNSELELAGTTKGLG